MRDAPRARRPTARWCRSRIRTARAGTRPGSARASTCCSGRWLTTGEYQVQAAIAALHADAPTAAETDWVQIVEWYDELVRLTDSPVARLNRAVAVGEADGAQAGLAALDDLDPSLPRYAAVAAHLHERAGDLSIAAELYREAAMVATSRPERDHLTRQAARLHALER
ncbi:hypothetical protein N866_02300 [Actinotalea ferrariae CF5-4]|uniref:RNA polymerase subunit sigma-24 n=1 Tax=Actinotalea ferrariae CF5-4 TaxID=948458 RepID=A0A021VT23_9CELL|nr:hypothetical protein N866_02300 [Actinotalea ferrariae CF5-4]